MRTVACIALLGSAGLALAAAPQSASAAKDVPCLEVVSELNRRITRNQSQQLAALARALEADPVHVEACLAQYGRRAKGPRTMPSPEPDRLDPFDADTPRGFQRRPLDRDPVERDPLE